MVLNAAVQMIREAEDLKEKILKFKSGTSMLQDRSLWTTQQQLQKIYEKVLVLDLDYALEKKVEQDLWNVGFKQQIEALQAISKDRKNPLRSEGQAMLSWILQAAAGFYLCLLHQICTTFKLDLPFRRRASLLGWVEGWGSTGGDAPANLPPPAAARYISQHCLVHLGDLARYRQQLRVAHTFYRHALLVSPHSGQPYNQLALVAWRRGRQLSALYWHARSLLVSAPFPPAPANLARTLAAAAATRTSDAMPMPVLPGLTMKMQSHQSLPTKIDSHNYVPELIRALNMIHTLEDLDTAKQLVNLLNSSLTALIATDSFEPITLIKMSCVIMWAVSSTEALQLEMAAMTPCEATAAALSSSLAAGTVLALLLPAYTREAPPTAAIPAIKIWLQWIKCNSQCLNVAAFISRPQIWPALAVTMNSLATYIAEFKGDSYTTLPLPEDEELIGFVPLAAALSPLQFSHRAAWETFGERLPLMRSRSDAGASGDEDDHYAPHCIRSPSDLTEATLCKTPELEGRIRASRIVELGVWLAGHLRERSSDYFTYNVEGDRGVFAALSGGGEQLARSVSLLGLDEPSPLAPPPPVVISEADFREKVREKRGGILKPQGSLERAREERALAINTQDDTEGEYEGEELSKAEDSKKESRKLRMNVAMAAIMRKQEETNNKQVKFVSPASTPEITSDNVETPKEDRPKVVQPKVIKSLANIPIGKKTGGILSLKDKSGYPHLVNTQDKVKTEEKKQEKPKNSESWPTPDKRPNTSPKQYQATQSIRLPVVNPKEIDVRTAALHKQNSRQEFPDNYHVSGDKKNFLNDLPPRFANQFRYWQHTPQENKFPEEFKPTNQRWPAAEYNQWWPETTQSYTAPSMTPNTYYSPYMNSYMQNQSPQHKPDNGPQNYMIQPQIQSLQSLVASPNFSSSNFSSYGPTTVGYNPNMYPQFNKMNYQQPIKMPDKPLLQYPKEPTMNFGQAIGEYQRNMSMQYKPMNQERTVDQVGQMEGSGAVASEIRGSTYSLFSGHEQTAPWGHSQQQSLWSGSSPLERLLEQQKQIKQPEPH